MKIPVFALFLIAACEGQSSSRISRGKDAFRGQFPYMAYIELSSLDELTICGGSLISKQFVLTAAHCLEPYDNARVYLGSVVVVNNPEGGQQVIDGEELIVHENYNKNTIENDVGLIKLEREAEIGDYVQILKIAYRLPVPLIGKNAIIAGWGRTGDAESAHESYHLQYATTKIVPNAYCQMFYPNPITMKLMCTSGLHEISPCPGDSGTPLVIQSFGRPLQVGIMSFGNSEGCKKNMPAVFVRLNTYLQWIRTKAGLQ